MTFFNLTIGLFHLFYSPLIYLMYVGLRLIVTVSEMYDK